jgi:hypothetical protein
MDQQMVQPEQVVVEDRGLHLILVRQMQAVEYKVTQVVQVHQTMAIQVITQAVAAVLVQSEA